jgi:hypothetical protein
MAELLDDEQQPEMELHEGETLGNLQEDNPADYESVEEPPVQQEQPTEENPDRFAGRSHDELLEMVREQDRRIGQQGNELGNMRQTFEAMSRAQSVPAQPEPQPVEEADFFVDPQRAVDSRIDNHPALRQAQEMAKQLKYAQSLSSLKQRHPDLERVVGSQEFETWVKSSPARVRRFAMADQSGDIDEADDLISTFKQLTQTVNTAKAAEKQATKKAVRAAAVGGTRSNPDAASSKRIYRRADIIALHQEDEDRYMALQPELMLAYAEGRVRD